MQPAILETSDVRRTFGGLVALDRVSFSVREGQVKGVIGPNGAGKTTLFNVISGFLGPHAGSIRFEGREITGLQPHRVARRGISRTFQSPSLFLNMSVLENVMVGRHCRTRCGITSAALRLRRQRREERAIHESAVRQLERVGMAHLSCEMVGSLSFGRRRMVELARALAMDPKLVLLDEPAAGLNTRETDDLAALIRRMSEEGLTILLVEHDMSLVMDVCEDILVLNFGTPIAEGDPETVRSDPRVAEVYLGGDFADA